MLIDDPQAFVGAFALPATYTASGAGAPIQAIVEAGATWDGINSSLRDTYNHGQVRLAMAWVDPATLPTTPVFGHTLEQGDVTWTVQDAWSEGDMCVLGLASGVFVVDVTVQRDADVSDGSLGHTQSPVAIWSGKAAIHGLNGKERQLAGREVGVGYRSGWMPACPSLVAGCRIITPREVLHVTSAYTDVERGWTVFEAEARQEEQN